MALPGLRRTCLESGRARASALRRIEDRAVVELGRASGRAKVFRELLASLRGTVSIVDQRAVSSIAKRLGLTARCVRVHLATLERAGVRQAEARLSMAFSSYACRGGGCRHHELLEY